MATAEELLAELESLAASLGPALRPVGDDALLRSLTETARQLFGAAACSLALLTDDETELVYTTAAGRGAEDVTGMRIPSDVGIAGWVIQSGQPIAVSDVSADQRFSRGVAEQTGYVPTAIVAVPVESARRVLGVLSLLDRDAGRPGADRDLQLLALFADQAAIALDSVAAFSDLGRVLLSALAAAAAEGSDLESQLVALGERATGADAELMELASIFAGLSRRGAAERRLALGVLREFGAYASRRPPRTR